MIAYQKHQVTQKQTNIHITDSAAASIRRACIIRNTSLSELARRLKSSSQNLQNKLKRDNFSILELQAIADALNAEFVAAIRL